MQRGIMWAFAVAVGWLTTATPVPAQTIPGLPGVPQSAPTPDNLFTLSGFKVRYANTSGRLARLRSLPPDRLVTRTRNGRTTYLYADPNGCVCVYVGTPDAWRTYQNGGPPGYIGDTSERSQPRFNPNIMVDEMGEDGDVSEPGAPTMDDYLFGE